MGDEDRKRFFKFLPRKPIHHFKLTLWVLLHWAVVVGNFLAFFILIYHGFHPSQTIPWYVALPLCTFIGVISTSRVLDCPLTAMENKMRKEVGLPPIKAFIKHYLLKPYARRRRSRRMKRKEKNE
ncbi:hypothetical protein CL634_02625 [bacterium]|nr:hypothetical protein [bacterium]|tara:strand:+ start:284 stop:658 length:375 start_codon:yes stop_codon:yes gene_type:complete